MICISLGRQEGCSTFEGKELVRKDLDRSLILVVSIDYLLGRLIIPGRVAVWSLIVKMRGGECRW